MNEKWIEDFFTLYNDNEYLKPRMIKVSQSFNNTGISLYYYVYGYDVDAFVAGLKIDFFDKVRFTNYKKPHPNPIYYPYFDKFRLGYNCSYEKMNDLVELESNFPDYIVNMAKHWKITTPKFITTLQIAYDFLFEADKNNWIGISGWDGGEFIDKLPPRKKGR